MREQDNLLGESDRFLAVLDHVSRLAPLNRPVLIMGERGTGKELIAQRLHYLSTRWSQPLVSLNCAALSEGLIDSELFGHEAGAFTSAKGRHAADLSALRAELYSWTRLLPRLRAFRKSYSV